MFALEAVFYLFFLLRVSTACQQCGFKSMQMQQWEIGGKNLASVV